MNANRIIFFDIVRALCAIQIIIIWHGLSYCYEDTIFFQVLAQLTGGALACFTFLSGLFNNTINKSANTFYVSRLKRFYVPYVLAYFSLVLINYNDYSLLNTFKSLTGLSCFLGGQPKTLWYIAMLIVFYVITPFICSKTEDGNRDSKGTLVRCSLVYLLFIIMFFFFPQFEVGILQYFPFYALGLSLSPSTVLESIHFRNNYKLLNVILFFLLYIFIIGFFLIDVKKTIVCCVGCLLFVLLSWICSRNSYLSRVLIYCSDASMFAYLFHRFFNYFVIVSFGEFGCMTTTICMFLIIFPISHSLQIFYNKLISEYAK